MSDSVNTILKDLKLDAFADKLAKLGVEQPSDVLALGDVDLGAAGLNMVQIRKLQRSASAFYEIICDDEEDGKVLPPPPSFLRTTSQAVRKTSKFWQGQMNRPRRLIFIRHGESEANVDRHITREVPDHLLHLTENGRDQAIDAGRRLKEIIGDETIKFIVSPYIRTRETFNGIKQAWGDQAEKLDWRTDVRIREQEFGNLDDPEMEQLHQQKKKFGAFYFRFPNGESPADCYDRASIFFETMYRRWEDNNKANHVIVGHGMMIVLLLKRFFRWSIDDWARIDGLKNCEFVVLERPVDDAFFNLAFTWVGGKEKDYTGMRKKVIKEEEVDIWDGKPDAPMIHSQSKTLSPRI